MPSPRARLLLSVALCAAVVAALAVPAGANHTGVQGTIEILRGTKQIDITTRTALCDGTFCTVDVPLTGTSYRRFLRWCGSDTIGVGITAGQFSGVAQCPGGGSWRAFLSASLAPSTHDSLVAVQIHAFRG